MATGWEGALAMMKQMLKWKWVRGDVARNKNASVATVAICLDDALIKPLLSVSLSCTRMRPWVKDWTSPIQSNIAGERCTSSRGSQSNMGLPWSNWMSKWIFHRWSYSGNFLLTMSSPPSPLPLQRDNPSDGFHNVQWCGRTKQATRISSVMKIKMCTSKPTYNANEARCTATLKLLLVTSNYLRPVSNISRWTLSIPFHHQMSTPIFWPPWMVSHYGHRRHHSKTPRRHQWSKRYSTRGYRLTVCQQPSQPTVELNSRQLSFVI